MICRKCPAGKQYTSGSVYCMEYGMIIREDHECRREGWKDYERDKDDGEHTGEREEAGFQEDGGGAAGVLPEVL